MNERATQAWVWRGSAIAVVLIGWVFIFFYNNMRFTPPTVFMALGFLAAVATVYTLFKTGAEAVSPDDVDNDEASWELSLGERGELEREKRTLLKAIKEAEFDQQMGKLSKQDADLMIRQYRARAIAVIKLLEDQGATQTITVRQQIEREVRARLAVDAIAGKRAAKDATAAQRRKGKKAAAAAQKAAREAAAAGAPAHVAQAAAAAAAATVPDDEDEPAEAAATDGGATKPDGEPAAPEATTDAAALEEREQATTQEKEATP